ncbi:zinc finger (C3HC4-type RING finger) family protein [Actinidia rufa]|uniref:Zinc finger (C3HC4-type RING finger) family protein n=1 Tax=Actinidia rufa TaxID=165716 RepID=A0A7J0GPR4_9ERIC|nr:zinc finger (C3HC4-type RING finger) family protein [Actinidia rufa]
MGSKWRKARLSLSCLHVPSTVEEDSPPSAGRFSESDSLSPAATSKDFPMPSTPTPSSSGLRLPIYGTKSSSKRMCAICLTTMKPGDGHAIFTAECSHSFHFHCITSNVKHGNQICPICRAKWKEIPFQNPPPDLSHVGARLNTVSLAQNDDWTTVLRRLPPRAHSSQNTCPEISAVSRSTSHNNFTILIHLKALTSRRRDCGVNEANVPPVSQNSRASIDLVAVLDVSGSMAGTKLALLKRAMGFVIQHLGPSDRLSVIAFSSTARRLFPLHRMTDAGRQEALQAVNGLISNGGTNIADGLKKGAKVMTDRKWKNPVGSIILLSDGQDTHTVNCTGGSRPQSDYQSLLPFSVHWNGSTGLHIPVHAFGFGEDHDSDLMHSISESSGGTFSFIEAESFIQDAFAQCIGGLLSVVVQELQVRVECVHPTLKLGSIKAGSYKTSVTPDGRLGFIDVGDLYAEEERDFLVTVDIPVDGTSNEMSLLKVKCVYKDPITKESVTFEEADELMIQRPEITGDLASSVEVDRQRNRLRAAEAIAEARVAAERGDLAGAVSVLEGCLEVMSETISSQAGDRLCVALGAELREMQERMANRRVYESTGRAYVLSGLSSHSWQRATARGDSTDSTSLVQSYQTPSMVDMVNRSQTMFLGSPLPQPPSARRLRQAKSFPARPQPR